MKQLIDISNGFIGPSYRSYLTKELDQKWPDSKIFSINFEELVKQYNIQIDKHLTKAICNNYEVWVNGQFYALSIDHPYYDDIKARLKLILKTNFTK
jgi:hypothetical protein